MEKIAKFMAKHPYLVVGSMIAELIWMLAFFLQVCFTPRHYRNLLVDNNANGPGLYMLYLQVLLLLGILIYNILFATVLELFTNPEITYRSVFRMAADLIVTVLTIALSGVHIGLFGKESTYINGVYQITLVL